MNTTRRNFIVGSLATAVALPSLVQANPLAHLEMFRTEGNLPFLYYKNTQVPFYDRGLPVYLTTLELHEFPLMAIPTVDELWRVSNNPNIKKPNIDGNKLAYVSNILCNDIARKTRRACGNIIIVSHDSQKEWLDANYNIRRNIRIVVDSSLHDNEVRVTYWKVYRNSTQFSSMDGGLQLSPDGLRGITEGLFDWRSYFVRGFM